MKQECENAILQYAPIIRQINAAIDGEHKEYVAIVIKLHRDHYRNLAEAGASEWTELPEAVIQWLNENKPY